jgi:predicted metalloprotease with PDZ domain
LLQSLAGNIKAHEAREGKHFQSLVQASYDTWSDGPFGRTGEGVKKTISYYDKGPVVGLLLDFTIRQHSKNQRSLDDVMRTLYYRYYKEKGRGFTDAEFRQACESAAGRSLADFFEYIYTTRELDYDTILAYAGLRLDKENWQLLRLTTIDENQEAIWKNWSRDRQNP